jgi:hypothetical protein
MAKSIDDEWASFISSNYNGDISSDEEEDSLGQDKLLDSLDASDSTDLSNGDIPKPSRLYISTKTKISYLNMAINLKDLFWKIPVIPYAKPCDGVVKKQMKFNSITREELSDIKERLKEVEFYDEHVLTSIDNPDGRIIFKDIRKINIGISKKDLLSYRCKKKSAFYNCFVLIFRMKVDDTFKEFHAKVFNTGKLEMPGVQDEDIFRRVLMLLIQTLQPYISSKIECLENSHETVLINSNFKCGFYINREALYDILKYKYNIQAIYDPCSYPGIQCKFYYNHDLITQTGSQISEENKRLYSNVSEISFMVFRTGSVLIVGKCVDETLVLIYEFLKNMLITEYAEISQKIIPLQECSVKAKKIRKRTIVVNT